MNRLKLCTWVTISLGILSIAAIGMCHLALTDIWHGEGDLSLEWLMLQIGFAIILLFHASAFFTLLKTSRLLGSPGR